MINNKFISISDKDRLRVFYPNYKWVTSIGHHTIAQNIIFDGDYYYGLENDIRLYSKSFISLVGKPDVFLQSKLDWLRLVYSRWGKNVPKYIVEQLKNITDESFYYGIQNVWFCRKWPYKQTDEESMYILYEEASHSFMKFLGCYYSLRRIYTFRYVESCFLQFLIRIKNYDSISVGEISNKYRSVIYSASKKIGNKLTLSLKSYLISDQSEDAFIGFLFSLFQ